MCVIEPLNTNNNNSSDPNLFGTQLVDISLVEGQVQSLLCVPVPEYVCPTAQACERPRFRISYM